MIIRLDKASALKIARRMGKEPHLLMEKSSRWWKWPETSTYLGKFRLSRTARNPRFWYYIAGNPTDVYSVIMSSNISLADCTELPNDPTGDPSCS